MIKLKSLWRSILKFITGPGDDPFRQIHNGFLFLASILLSVATWINHSFNLTEAWFNLFTALFVPLILVLWAWSRWARAKFRQAGLAFAILVSTTALPVTWFANGGMDGPTLLFYLATLLYAGGLLQGQRVLAWVTLTLIALSPVILITLELHFPNWVHQYNDQDSRSLDLSLSYLLVLGLISVMLLGHFNRYQIELRRSAKLASRLRHLADHDGLTRLLNHRAGLDRAIELQRQGRLHALLFCDLDHFKTINDRYGHPFGDRILRQFARILQSTCIHYDAECARYGGEEFLIILTRQDHGIAEIDRLLRIQMDEIPLPDGTATFSSGATRVVPDESVSTALARADHALYKAKHGGRNQLVMMSHERNPLPPASDDSRQDKD